jgi:hypothetical protein
LSKPTVVGCFFLDTCIILSDILKENTARIEKLKKNVSFYNIPCYISDSVKQEICKKVQDTSDFLGNTVRETIRYHLEESRKKRNIPFKDPITSDDIKALEDLFAYYHNAVRTTKVALPSPVDLIEEWTISFLGEMLDKGTVITIEDFLRELIKKLLELTSYIEDSYDALVTFQKGFIKTKNITLDSRIIDALQNLGLHRPDCEHIASAIIHQAETKEKTVFVTLDFNSILYMRDLIRKQFNMECCDPLYALHHLI